jgi:hypothetical protein
MNCEHELLTLLPVYLELFSIQICGLCSHENLLKHLYSILIVALYLREIIIIKL